MTREDITRMAREAGWDEMGADLWGAKFDGAMSIHALERFAALVAAAEREACAKVCEERMAYWHRGDPNIYEDEMCAAAIRARKDKQ